MATEQPQVLHPAPISVSLQTPSENAVQNNEAVILKPKNAHGCRRELLNDIEVNAPAKLIRFLEKHLPEDFPTLPLVVASQSGFPQDGEVQKTDCIFAKEQLNNIRFLNKFLEAANDRLAKDGLFIGCVQTSEHRKQRNLHRYPFPLNKLVCLFEFAAHRVLPKLPHLRKVYFAITKGKNRIISKIETFGRLYSCGFSLVATKTIEQKLYFIVRKTGEPAFNMQATYSPLVKLKRIGKGGKPIRVYKLRTMHPYSEYLQQYVYEKYGLQAGGKIKNDPRVHLIGRFSRKYWLDELPMLWNIVRGDLKLVGVRPISRHYLSLYPQEFVQFRNEFKPGFIPPFYADLPQTLEEIVDSERRYLEKYQKMGFLADLQYLYRSLYNVFFKKARSS